MTKENMSRFEERATLWLFHKVKRFSDHIQVVFPDGRTEPVSSLLPDVNGSKPQRFESISIIDKVYSFSDFLTIYKEIRKDSEVDFEALAKERAALEAPLEDLISALIFNRWSTLTTSKVVSKDYRQHVSTDVNTEKSALAFENEVLRRVISEHAEKLPDYFKAVSPKSLTPEIMEAYTATWYEPSVKVEVKDGSLILLAVEWNRLNNYDPGAYLIFEQLTYLYLKSVNLGEEDNWLAIFKSEDLLGLPVLWHSALVCSLLEEEIRPETVLLLNSLSANFLAEHLQKSQSNGALDVYSAALKALSAAAKALN